jgi:hypothetical protein
MEPFITPTIYQQYPGAVDEWTLSTLMAADTANGGLSQLEAHYNTFIVSLVSRLHLVPSLFHFADRGRFCANGRCRAELD